MPRIKDRRYLYGEPWTSGLLNNSDDGASNLEREYLKGLKGIVFDSYILLKIVASPQAIVRIFSKVLPL